MTNLQFKLIVTGAIVLLVLLGVNFGDPDRVNMMDKTREWLQQK